MKIPLCCVSVSLIFLAFFALTIAVEYEKTTSALTSTNSAITSRNNTKPTKKTTAMSAKDEDEDTTTTAPSSALPLQMPLHKQRMEYDDNEDDGHYYNNNPNHQHRNDYNAFQMFKHLVYPLKFAETQSMQRPAFAWRNITQDALQLLQRPHNRNSLTTNASSSSVEKPYWERSDYPASVSTAAEATLQDRNYYQSAPAVAYQQPHTFQYAGGGGNGFGSNAVAGMSNLMDPLFVMATLAFVTFLINSILGLVDRLNLLPPVNRARQRHGKYAAGNREWILWPNHRGIEDVGREDLLEDLESRIRMAFEEYELCYVADNCKRSGRR